MPVSLWISQYNIFYLFIFVFGVGLVMLAWRLWIKENKKPRAFVKF